MQKIIDLFAKQSYYFLSMENMKEFNWLYQGHQQSNDKKPESELFLLPNILKYFGWCKEKKIVWWKSTSGNEKEKPVSQCLEVYTSSKDRAFLYYPPNAS